RTAGVAMNQNHRRTFADGVIDNLHSVFRLEGVFFWCGLSGCYAHQQQQTQHEQRSIEAFHGLLLGWVSNETCLATTLNYKTLHWPVGFSAVFGSNPRCSRNHAAAALELISNASPMYISKCVMPGTRSNFFGPVSTSIAA